MRPDPSIGRRIETYRKRRGLSRRVLADLIGRSQEWLRQVEKGLRPLDSLEALTRLSAVLRIKDWSELLPIRDFGHRRPSAEQADPLVEVLRRALFGLPPPSPPVGRADSTREVDELWSSWRAAGRRFEPVAQRVAEALWRCQEASEPSADGDEAGTVPVGRDHTRALLLLRLILSRLGEHDLAYIAAQRAVRHCDPRVAPVLYGCCRQAMALDLCRIGYRVEARDLAAAALDRLADGSDEAVERRQAAAGLALCAAGIEADLGEQRAFEQFVARAEALLDEADEQRSQDRRSDVDLLSPGPGGLDTVRVQGMLSLGQVEPALHLALHGAPGNRLSIDERVDHDITLAHVHANRGDDSTALLMLLRVERVSPDDLRYDARAREVVQILWDTRIPTVRTELSHLTERLEGVEHRERAR